MWPIAVAPLLTWGRWLILGDVSHSAWLEADREHEDETVFAEQIGE